METSLSGIVNSAQMGSRLIEAIGSHHLKILWDPANCLYCGEKPMPEGYAALKNGGLGHVHVKDVRSFPARSTIDCCPLGRGDMREFLHPLASQLIGDGYRGAVCFENVYTPNQGTLEDGFLASIDVFKSLFKTSRAHSAGPTSDAFNT